MSRGDGSRLECVGVSRSISRRLRGVSDGSA